jgi:hypothetical protein
MEYGKGFKVDAASTLEPYFRNSCSCAFGAPMTHENGFYWERGRLARRILADTDSFPKQESMRRFRGIVVDRAVLEHDITVHPIPSGDPDRNSVCARVV